MIVDGHAYCFPPFGDPAGYDTLDDKLIVFQRDLGGHHQPVWRVRDRASAGSDTLLDPDTGEPRDVRWSIGTYAFTWEQDGETYTKQYFPPMLHRMDASPELLIREMDYADVGLALLHTSPYLGRVNGYLAEAVSRYPDRLRRLVALPEAGIALDTDAALAAVDEQIAAGGVVGYQFLSKHYSEGGYAEPWDDGPMRPFWAGLADRGVTVYFTVRAGRAGGGYGGTDREAYVEEYQVLRRWTQRYRDATSVVTHGMPWRSFMHGEGGFGIPGAIWQVFDSPRCHMQIMVPIQLGNLWDYPWKEAEPAIIEAVRRLGSERLIWGTDMPIVARFCTYRQTLDHIRRHCGFLNDSQRRDLLGATAARLMGIDATGITA